MASGHRQCSDHTWCVHRRRRLRAVWLAATIIDFHAVEFVTERIVNAARLIASSEAFSDSHRSPARIPASSTYCMSEEMRWEATSITSWNLVTTRTRPENRSRNLLG